MNWICSNQGQGQKQAHYECHSFRLLSRSIEWAEPPDEWHTSTAWKETVWRPEHRSNKSTRPEWILFFFKNRTKIMQINERTISKKKKIEKMKKKKDVEFLPWPRLALSNTFSTLVGYPVVEPMRRLNGAERRVETVSATPSITLLYFCKLDSTCRGWAKQVGH